MVTQIYNIRSGDPDLQKFGYPDLQKFGWPLPPKFGGPKTSKISARFRTTSRLDREYLQNTKRHCQSENSIANYGHSRTGKLNWVYFGRQMVKNRTGVLTYPTGGHHDGHCQLRIWFLVQYLSGSLGILYVKFARCVTP